jgi:hypothetical protein
VFQADPVLLFTFSQVAPGDTREISYEATVSGSDPPATRLARLQSDQQAAEASFDRQNAIVVSQLQTLTITPAVMVIPAGQSVTVTLAGTLDSGGSAPAQALTAVWTSSRPDVVTVDGPTFSAGVPVFDSPDAGNGAKQVGVLHLGGDTNWFVGQSYRSTFVSGALRNGWWAFTLSDKDSSGTSHWGWVPETYFKGGGNDESDAGLFVCGTHANSCSP